MTTLGCAHAESPMSADVTLRQLRYFVVLGEELNYRRAAERLFITQPALSTAIKQLEHQFGVLLFNRSTREVALTDLGAAWLPQVQQAICAASTPSSTTWSSLSGTRQGVLRLGYLIGTGADLLFRVVRHFEAAYPEISVEPMEYDFADPTAGLADGSTEVAIIRPPVDLPEHRMLMLDAEDVGGVPAARPPAGRPHRGRDRRTARRSDRVRAADGRPMARLLAGDGRRGGNRPPTIAAVAATYEAETTTIARGLGISFTSVVGRPASTTGRASSTCRSSDRPPQLHGAGVAPRRLSPQADALVRQVQTQWSFGEGRRPTTASLINRRYE